MKISSTVMGTMMSMRASARNFALVLTLPSDVIAARKLHLLVDFLNGLPDRVAQSAVANAVLDGDIALVVFAIDLRALVGFLDGAELSQRNAFARWR